MSSTSRRVPSGRIRTCDRADQDRGTEAFISLTLSAPALLLGFVLLIEYSPPLVVMLFSIGLGLMLHGAGRLARPRPTPTTDNRWRTGNGCICFGPSWGFLLWEQLPPSAITVGAISTLCIIYASHDAHSDRTGTLILSLVPCPSIHRELPNSSSTPPDYGCGPTDGTAHTFHGTGGRSSQGEYAVMRNRAPSSPSTSATQYMSLCLPSL